MGRRWIKLAGAVGLGAVITVLVLAWRIGAVGTTGVEAMVAARLQLVAGSYLRPSLTLGELDYQYPRTVVVRDARLTTADGLDLVSVDRMTLVLERLPRANEPMQIQRLTLESPRVLIADATRSAGQVLGWSHLLRSAPEPQAQSNTPRPRISDVFQVRRLDIENGHIRYEDRNRDDDPLPPMELAGVAAGLDIQPDEQGWYVLDTTITGPAMFNTQLAGRLNLDDAELDLTTLRLTMHLNRGTDGALPPVMQAWLAHHGVSGRLRVQGQGRIPLASPADAQATIDLRIDGASGVFDQFALDLSELSGRAVLADGHFALRDVAAKGYDGSASGEVELHLAPPHSLSLKAAGKGIRLERLIRAAGSDDQARRTHEGVVSFDTDLHAPLHMLDHAAAGTGWLSVREGRLIALPLLARLRAVMGLGDAAEPDTATPAGNDRADLEWRYEGDHLQFSQLEAITRWLAVRGDGKLYFDGSLDLRLNGGPLERLQHTMGFVGDWMGRVTDKLVTYTVTGRVGDPVVSARPLGMGVGRDRTASTPTTADEP
mgnify:CR=1 FL=1